MDQEVEALIFLGGLTAIVLIGWAAWSMGRRKPEA